MSRIALRFSPCLSTSCMSGEHRACSGNYASFIRCACSCHHVQTVDGRCAMYDCKCHVHRDHPGVPYHPPHTVACRLWVLDG